MINPNTYKDIELLPTLVDNVLSFTQRGDLSNFFIDVGEFNVGKSINWKAIVVWDVTGNYVIENELKEVAEPIIDIAKNIPGLQRITINFLGPMSVMPMHQDSEGYTNDYNMIIPITDNGWFLLDGKVFKSSKNEKIVFDGCILHGVMNDSFDERISLYLLIDKGRFYDSAK